MPSSGTLVTCVAFWAALTPGRPSAAFAQDTVAQREIATAVDSLGGEQLLRGIISLSISGRGTVDASAQIQGPKPSGSAPLWRRERLTVDRASERSALEYTEPRDDGSIRSRRFSYRGNELTVVDFTNRAMGRSPFPAAGRVRGELARRVPHFLLLEALDHPEALHALPDTLLEGKPFHVIELILPDEATPVTLYLSTATARLMRIGYRMDFPGIPDARIEVRFAPYRAQERLGAFPTGHTLLIEGRVLHSINYTEVLVNDPRIEEAFAVPDDIAAQQASGGAITTPAPGVYVVNGLGSFTAMFIEFRDFVMAVEAPAESYAEFDQFPVGGLSPSTRISDSIIALIHATVPGKPIRYVTVSHFHNDHSGGVPSFWADGATLLTTPGTRQYFEELGRAVAGTGAARISTVADRRVISDGTREVVLLNVGPNGHTAEALVVYLPRERILYQGDQFYYDGDGSFPPRDRVRVMRTFARWVARARLKVDRIYGTHMRGYATARHLRLVLAQGAARTQ